MFVRIFVYLGSEFVWMSLTFDWNSALDSPDRGRNLLREHWQHWLVFQDSSKFLDGLIMYSCSKYLPQPSRWIAGLTIWKLWSFCNSWEKFKTLLLSFLRYFDWYHMHLNWLRKYKFCSKGEFSFEYWHLFYPSH